ncbi:hypothetical protein C6499_07665 [Candidatus Poribacteria bacterium]|nr:MAG: hypothetical protein C6499_07665 [Candidatus Poribacteria bacterium]
MLNFLTKGFKRMMVNIEKMIDEIRSMTVSEAFPLVKALKDKFGATWPPTLITNVTTADGEVKLDAETRIYTVGGSAATFKIEPTAAPNTYSSVKLVQTAPDGAKTEFIADAGLSEITVDVGTFENGLYSFHALTVDEFGNLQTNESPKIKVHVKNEVPNVSTITIDEAQKINPDSGAPQGNLIVNAYTPQRATPIITKVRFEVKQSQNTEWQSVGEIDQSTAVLVPAQEQWKWTIEVDTTTLDDTITANSPAARDVSLDPSPYTIRAVAIADGQEIISPDGVIEKFSVDNIDDVAPIGPTKIIEVTIPDGMIPVDETIAYKTRKTSGSSVAIFVIQPTADPETYSSVKLMRTDADGMQSECKGLTVRSGIKTASEAGTGYSGNTVKFDISSLKNGLYVFHALAVDSDGNVQTDDSPGIKFFIRESPLPPKPTEDSDRLNRVSNPNRRTRQLQQQLRDAPKKNYESRSRSVRTTRGTIDPRTQLREEYTSDSGEMECQLCKEAMPFKNREGKPYFEAVEALTNEHFTREHEAQFLALCPECAARYQEFVKRVPGAVENLKNELMNADDLEVHLQLGELKTSIRFSKRHWHDIQTILRFYKANSTVDPTEDNL